MKRMEVLLVEDNPGDVGLMEMCMEQARIENRLTVVTDGVQAMSYLRRGDGYEAAPRPDLVLLDLNLPKKNGREVLAEIKGDEDLRRIPVVVLTSSDADGDACAVYDLQANSFVTKPPTVEGLCAAWKQLEGYWFETVKLPLK